MVPCLWNAVTFEACLPYFPLGIRPKHLFLPKLLTEKLQFIWLCLWSACSMWIIYQYHFKLQCFMLFLAELHCFICLLTQVSGGGEKTSTEANCWWGVSKEGKKYFGKDYTSSYSASSQGRGVEARARYIQECVVLSIGVN